MKANVRDLYHRVDSYLIGFKICLKLLIVITDDRAYIVVQSYGRDSTGHTWFKYIIL